MDDYKKLFARNLKKTKVDLHASEFQIATYIDEFMNQCAKTECENCEIVASSNKLGFSNLCLARYIYEKTVKTFTILDVEHLVNKVGD